MVSALWMACLSGDLETVRNLLNETTNLDIEVKDHTGVTPLINAVKNGHVEVVKALLDKGADPQNSSSQGPPSTYTSHESILELLAASHVRSSGAPPHPPTSGQGADSNAENAHQYESSPPADYTYYPSLNSALSPPLEGGAEYYPHPPIQNTDSIGGPGGLGNLPPLEIAKLIPCRYFPACRYGASCIFAHPQQYYPPSLPHQYVAPYDPVNVQTYSQNYFPPPFQPNGIHPVSPMSPPSAPHTGHGHSPSEVALPGQSPFSPNGASPVPYGPMPPNTYPPPGHAPMMVPPLPSQPQTILPGQHPSNMYNTAPPPAKPYVQQDGSLPYPVAQLGKPNTVLQDVNGDAKTPDGPVHNNHHPDNRDSMGYHRRGGRRGSFNNRKPPCMFFPSGRCKNGDDCRFPHVLPNNVSNGTQPTPYPSGRSGTRPRNVNGNGASNNGKSLASTVRDDDLHQRNNEALSRPDQGRHRFHQGSKNGYGQNINRADKRAQPQKQRVPNADEFPVLAGSTTPPTRNTSANGVSPNGNGHAGPTAAQILQAPPPSRKENQKKISTRGMTTESLKSPVPKVETIAVTETAPATTIVHDCPPTTTTTLTASFPKVAAPEMPKEITLSA